MTEQSTTRDQILEAASKHSHKGDISVRRGQLLYTLSTDADRMAAPIQVGQQNLAKFHRPGDNHARQRVYLEPSAKQHWLHLAAGNLRESENPLEDLRSSLKALSEQESNKFGTHTPYHQHLASALVSHIIFDLPRPALPEHPKTLLELASSLERAGLTRTVPRTHIKTFLTAAREAAKARLSEVLEDEHAAGRVKPAHDTLGRLSHMTEGEYALQQAANVRAAVTEQLETDDQDEYTLIEQAQKMVENWRTDSFPKRYDTLGFTNFTYQLPTAIEHPLIKIEIDNIAQTIQQVSDRYVHLNDPTRDCETEQMRAVTNALKELATNEESDAEHLSDQARQSLLVTALTAEQRRIAMIRSAMVRTLSGKEQMSQAPSRILRLAHLDAMVAVTMAAQALHRKRHIRSAAALATSAAFAAARLCRTSVYKRNKAAALEAQDASYDARAILLAIPYPYISYDDINAIQANATLPTS